MSKMWIALPSTALRVVGMSLKEVLAVMQFNDVTQLQLDLKKDGRVMLCSVIIHDMMDSDEYTEKYSVS